MVPAAVGAVPVLEAAAPAAKTAVVSAAAVGEGSGGLAEAVTGCGGRVWSRSGGAALLVLSLLIAYRWDVAVLIATVGAQWFALVLAALAFTAGTVTLGTGAKRSIGPGLLGGAAAGSTWGLVSLANDEPPWAKSAAASVSCCSPTPS